MSLHGAPMLAQSPLTRLRSTTVNGGDKMCQMAG